MVETMSAIKELQLQCIVIKPNIDVSGLEIIRAINECEVLPFIHTYDNLERNVFISLLKESDVIVGNSSCGILEAPSFKLPAINIGNRQRGRMQAVNVINVDYDRMQIKDGMEKALHNKTFRDELKDCVNPYGDGHSSGKIVKILEEIKINEKLLDKRITY
jgi:UDP-N-acetylglucosamine 2-epimerase